MSKTSLSALLPPLRILILGYGHVAQAFLPLLASRSEWLGRESGIRPVITGIGSRSRGLYIYSDGINADLLAREQDPLSLLSSAGTRMENFETFIQAGKKAGASLFIELTTLNPLDGQPALRHIRKAFESGMDVITANKGPVAYAQRELQSLARRYAIQFRFESAVMDGLPLINMAEFTLPAVGIQSFKATLNSTSTLVLNMIEQGYSFDEAIGKAQQIGITENDPWYDLDGWDSVMKTTILANSLLEGNLTPKIVEREGIRNLTTDEICAAALAGSPYRLVSQAHRKNGVFFAEVRPRRISSDDTLRIGKGTTGVISIETEAMGTITLVEHEPSVMQTAYGVLSDLITIVRLRSSNLK
jgi:homoserine dehydrogenase